MLDTAPFTGTILINHGGSAKIVDETHGQQYDVLHQKSTQDITCGDKINYEPLGGTQAKITHIYPRKTELYRLKQGKKKPIAANIDYITVIMAPLPAPDWFLIDQYILFAKIQNIGIELVLNKCDLKKNAVARITEKLNDYRDKHVVDGIFFLTNSHQEAQCVDALFKQKKNQRCILVGQSGTGKSTILKALLEKPEIKTQKLQQGQGSHCTAYTRLYQHDTLQMIDSPGIRNLEIFKPTLAEVKKGFPDIQTFARHCRFQDCRHQQEPECAVREAIEAQKLEPMRLQSYHKIMSLYELV